MERLEFLPDDGQTAPVECSSSACLENVDLGIPPVKIATASAPAGISVFSAYAFGRGAVAAISHRISVLAYSLGPRDLNSGIRDVKDSHWYLKECARQILTKEEVGKLSFVVDSDLPQGRGLKTSAAVGVAACAAAAEAWGRPVEKSNLVCASSEAAKICGVTQAGSFDDGWCAAAGGVVVADENTKRLIDRWQAPDDIDVIVFIPSRRAHAAHFVDRRVLMRPYASEFRELSARLLETRDIMPVMTAASYLTAEAFGYERSLLDLSLRAGALGVSLSGKGPAVAALTEAGGGGRVVEAWSRFAGHVIRTSLENGGLRSDVNYMDASYARPEWEIRV